MESGYKVCPDCGHTYSTLVRHKCFKAPEQKDPPKFENPPEGGDESEPDEGQGQGQGQGEQGEGQSDQGEGEGEGQGEGDEESGEGEGDEEKEGEGKAEGEPPPPEPTAMEMVTLLRYAARTAADATAFIKVEVAFKGLAIFAQNGDEFAEVLVPWEKLASQDTRAAEDAILEAVKDVDYKVCGQPEGEPEEEGWIVLPTGVRDASCCPEGNPRVTVALYGHEGLETAPANDFYWYNRSGNDPWAIKAYKIER